MLDGYILTTPDLDDAGAPVVRAFVLASEDGWALVRPRLGASDRLVSFRKITKDYELWATLDALMAEHVPSSAELSWLSHWGITSPSS